jgi:peptide/nickel transport system substrate-binding protein
MSNSGGGNQLSDDKLSTEYGQHLVEEVRSGRMTRRQLLVRASVLGLSASAAGGLLAACGSSSSSTSASAAPSSAAAVKTGGTIRVSAPVSLTALDPVTMYDTGGIATVDQVCEYLAWVENDLTLRPVLAQSWSPDAAAKVWTFKLRQGVKFNDGTPFGADDVVATFERLVNPKSGSAALSALAGILSPGGTVKVDDSTVAFHLDRAFADFPYLVSSADYNAVILPKSYSGNFAKNPVGTGPFMMTAYTTGQSATFKKNPNYWQKGLPYLDGLQFEYSNDAAGVTLALQAGSIDVQVQTAYQGSQALFSDPNIDVLTIPSTGFRELAMRVDKAPFTDKRVRQAIALCLDRPAIIQGLFKGKALIGNDEIFSTLYPNSPNIPQRTQNIAQAKSLLAAAGHPSGIDITLTTEQYLEVPQYATLIQAMCKPAGINVKIQLMSYTQYYSGPGNNQPWLQAAMDITDWAPRAIPSQFILPMLTSTGVWNSSHWKNPQFDKLSLQYDATVDQASRSKIATQMATIQQDETPVIIAFWIDQLRAVSTKVHNVGGPGSVWIDFSKTYIS